MELPHWITQREDRPFMFTIDADRYYSETAAELGIETGTITQYDLEVIHNFCKLDAQLAINVAGLNPAPEATPVFNITGTGDYKKRWGMAHAPEGKYSELRAQNEHEYAKVVAAEAREKYRNLRGFLPG